MMKSANKNNILNKNKKIIINNQIIQKSQVFISSPIISDVKINGKNFYIIKDVQGPKGFKLKVIANYPNNENLTISSVNNTDFFIIYENQISRKMISYSTDTPNNYDLESIEFINNFFDQLSNGYKIFNQLHEAYKNINIITNLEKLQNYQPEKIDFTKLSVQQISKEVENNSKGQD